MSEKQTCTCGAVADAGKNFCGECGKSLGKSGSRLLCPHCGNRVSASNFCPDCGGNLSKRPGEPVIRGGIWERGENDVAIRVSAEMMNRAAKGGIEVRHGTKAIFLEAGSLVEVAESGRYAAQDGGFLDRLFKRKKELSAVLVDAGVVRLPFEFKELRTQDGIFVTLSMDVMLKIEDPNVFFVNVMKERSAFKIHDLRIMLFGEMRNALQEAVLHHDFDSLDQSRSVKDELTSRMEMHLRQTFNRSGFGFDQIQAMTVSQETLDGVIRGEADDEVEKRRIDAEALGRLKTGKAELRAESIDRDLKGQRIEGKQADTELKIDEGEAVLDRKERIGDLHIKDRYLDAAFIQKRLDVLKKIQETDIDKIKTQEAFRKFKLEVDRDKMLDASEWETFEDEILWKKDDRRRDRRFLISKLERMQAHELALLQLSNQTDLSMEQKRAQASILQLDLQGKIDRDMQRIEGLAKIKQKRAEADVAEKEIRVIGDKEIEIREKMKDLEFEKQRLRQAIELEKEKEQARFEVKKLDIEEKRLKSDLGLTNLEKLKAIKRKDQFEKEIHQLKMEQDRLEQRLRKEEARHRQELEKIKTKSQVEIDRMTVLSGLNIEQLISVSDQNQAKMLGDLAQSQSLRGMSAEEIMAMKDPAALGKALEERAKSTQNDDLKVLYERMLAQAQAGGERVAQAHKEGADRTERMYGVGMKATGERSRDLVQAERNAADRTERIADGAMDRMSNVAAARGAHTAGKTELGARQEKKVFLCPNCKQEVKSGKNFCQNCGTKMY